MEQTARISVIVPVFNAEAYLSECIESVLNQSYRNVELILVDDGSTDGSLEICRSWERDPRVRIRSTDNHGVSHARNLGLELASGEWVTFLDSDDYLLENALEQLMALTSPEAQEIIADYTDGAVEQVMLRQKTVDAQAVRTMTLDSINNHLLPEFYGLKPMSLAACWAKLYRNGIIREKGIRFHEDLRLSEDTLFNLEYLSCIDSVVITDLPVLFYRCHESSVTKAFRGEHLEDRFRFFDILKQRQDPGYGVHICALLFYEICKLERCTKGRQRRQLERSVTGFLEKNRALLRSIGDRALSEGRWQRMFYRAAAVCFGSRAYFVGFALLRGYSAITKGELSRIRGKKDNDFEGTAALRRSIG